MATQATVPAPDDSSSSVPTIISAIAPRLP